VLLAKWESRILNLDHIVRPTCYYISLNSSSNCLGILALKWKIVQLSKDSAFIAKGGGGEKWDHPILREHIKYLNKFIYFTLDSFVSSTCVFVIFILKFYSTCGSGCIHISSCEWGPNYQPIFSLLDWIQGN
jgi:hypothetical protein